MIKAVIFDFDGVLVESVDIKTKAFAKLFEPEGDEVVRKVVNHHIKNGGVSRFEKFRHIYANILRKELSDNEFKRLCDRFSQLVAEEVAKAPYVAGAKEFLDSCGSFYALFLLSGTPQAEIEEILKARHMSHYFKEIHGAPKEKRAVVGQIVSSGGFKPYEVLYVGDALSDHDAAKVNRIHFIARINNNEALFSKLGCAEVRDLRGLKEAIAKVER